MVWAQNLYEKIISKKTIKTKKFDISRFCCCFFKPKKQKIKNHLFHPWCPHSCRRNENFRTHLTAICCSWRHLDLRFLRLRWRCCLVQRLSSSHFFCKTLRIYVLRICSKLKYRVRTLLRQSTRCSVSYTPVHYSDWDTLQGHPELSWLDSHPTSVLT